MWIRIFSSLARAFAEARLQRELEHLDDRLLADVGIRRNGGRLMRATGSPAGAAKDFRIRDADEDDMAQVQRIYAHHVLNGSASFEETPPTIDELLARRSAMLQHRLPWLVADRDGEIIGYSYATPYRPRPAYRYTIENSIYVAAGEQRRGVGRALLQALIAQCEDGPWRQMVAVIGDSGNAGSIGLHKRLGFRAVGTLGAVGWKFERWTDSVLMQRALGSGRNSPPGTVTP